jgi:hypothetical protein
MIPKSLDTTKAILTNTKDSPVALLAPSNIPEDEAGAKAEADATSVATIAALVNIVGSITSRLCVCWNTRRNVKIIRKEREQGMLSYVIVGWASTKQLKAKIAATAMATCADNVRWTDVI